MQTVLISAQSEKFQSQTHVTVQSLIRLEVESLDFDHGLQVEYCCRTIRSVVAEFRKLFQGL